MSDDSSMGSAFVKGLGALVAALFLFVAEQYIQHRYWPDNPASSAPIPIDGRVIDASGTTVITNAIVDLSINGLHEDQNTDSDGRYAFSLEGFDPNTAASMTVKAAGYKDVSVNLLLSAMEEDKELKLEALATAPTLGHSVGAAAGAHPVGQAPALPVRSLADVKYVRRTDPKVLVAHN
jgi:hypothetical protein